jgi:hypothetical protein
MRGKKTSPQQIEEIKALSLVYSPATVALKTGVSLRTIYEVLKRKDDPKIEAVREQKKQEIVEKVWDKQEGELLKLKTKSDLILDAINDEKIAKARLTELSIAYGTLFDKRRLLSDQSTQNVASLIYLQTESDKLARSTGSINSNKEENKMEQEGNEE